MAAPDLPTRYDASQVEAKWYEAWEAAGDFQPFGSGPRFTITIPPPNITGSLHMGHALSYSLQDLLGRYRRMRGDQVQIVPGQDHAGIGAQSVVLKELRKEGVDIRTLTREQFLERAWEWRRSSGDTILKQFRALGCSFDWNETKFTLDEGYVRAVLETFVDWHDRGLIYRGLRVVNWDPQLQTSVSDIETERKTLQGKLYHVRYPFADGSGHVIVATTRPETMIADVAVAVHPGDSRYHGLVGKTLILPLFGREIPLIADQYPDPEFGTGAVKITPGHDANDWEVGQRHGLDVLIALDPQAKVNELGGDLQGLDRFEARKRIVARLKEADLLEKEEDHEIPMIISQRSGEIVEPMASEQWFVRQTELAKPAIEAVKDGRIHFTPARFNGVYLDWMENIRDWCISRQLWWGHRIPVFYTEDGRTVAALDWEQAEAKAGEKIVRQDNDVLDTWFSSGLWPFAVLGWPDQTQQLADRYPTSSLVTARDIIYLWVARMIMMGLDRAGDIPFREVLIHATVLTEDGKRMSKSLGTGIDPMTIIDSKGADSLRYGLLSQAGTGQDLRYGERKAEEASAFCNKIWNASRFMLMNMEGWDPSATPELQPEDRWLMSRLHHTVKAVTEAFEARDIQSACQSLYQFFWSEVCDWYIEISKGRLQDPEQRQAPQHVLRTALDAFLRMMHPVMPFITDAIHENLPGRESSDHLVRWSWPNAEDYPSDSAAEQQVEGWFASVKAFRALRAELALTPRQMIPAAFYEGDLQGGEAVFRSQAWVQEVRQGKPTEACISTSLHGIDLHLPTKGLIDVEKERAKAEADLAKKVAEREKLAQRLSNPQFTERAKPEVIQRDQQALAELDELVAKLTARLASLKE